MPLACVRVLVRGAADVPLSLGQPGTTRGRDTGRWGRERRRSTLFVALGVM